LKIHVFPAKAHCRFEFAEGNDARAVDVQTVAVAVATRESVVTPPARNA
jgi:hypothetical protein